MADFLSQYKLSPVYADQGAAGGEAVKTTEFRVSQSALSAAKLDLGTLRVSGYQQHGKSVAGSEGDYGKASHLQVYPADLCRRIARVLLASVELLSVSASPTVEKSKPTLLLGVKCQEREIRSVSLFSSRQINGLLRLEYFATVRY